MSKKSTTFSFIKNAMNIHNNKYDYSLVEYLNAKTKVKIICEKHGKFIQNPQKHLTGQGCPKCSGKNKTTISFIMEAKTKHNNKYDYSLANYINNKTKIQIICSKHGIFEQTPGNHLYGQCCPKCSLLYKKTYKKNNEKFIYDAKIKHGNKYDYSMVDYLTNSDKIKINCVIHGTFEQTPIKHISGHGCPKCSGKNKTTNEIISEFNLIHKNKYDYSLVDYKKSKKKVKIVCSIHGIFEQSYEVHIKGSGCPNCANIKSRTRRIKQIEKDKLNGHQLIPSYNSNACEIFDKISKEKNIHIQHAQNGGEYHLKELGYWVDGYDIKNNIVYEFDEKYHESEKQQKKDLIRQNEIINHLECEFIRIKENI